MNKYSGFTLVELLIASSISIAILFTLYISFNAGVFGYRRIRDALNTSVTATRVLSRLNLDLRNSFPFSPAEARLEGNSEEVSFFTLTDTVRQNMTTQDYAHVLYGLEEGRLLRTCRRNQDSISNITETRAQVLAANLTGVSFSYGVFNPEDKTLQWQDTWNQSSGLPASVKVVLTINDDGEGKDNFERTIFLPLASIDE